MAIVEQGVGTGVSFALTEEQRELRQLARDFAEKEIRPKAAEYDEHQTHAADLVEKAHAPGLRPRALCCRGLHRPRCRLQAAAVRPAASRLVRRHRLQRPGQGAEAAG